MMENIEFTINIDEVKKVYIGKKGTIQHNRNPRFKMLPYTTDEKNQMIEFDGVIGAFSRIICEKSLSTPIDVNELVENVVQAIDEFNGVTSNDNFRSIIRSIFINEDGNLVNFNMKAINYIASSNEDVKFAEFIYCIFFDEELKEYVKNGYNKREINILNKLILNALPNLDDKKYDMYKYKCYLPFIKELFITDFKFLIENEELYKSNLKRFLEYYYMFYVSQLSIKLNKFHKADLKKADILYYTLSWESISKNRTAYKFGYDLVSNNVNSIFSHAVTLDLANYHDRKCKLTYTELYNLFKNMDEYKNNINDLYYFYINAIKDIRWDNAELSYKDSDNNQFNILLKLFSAVDYQFNNSQRYTPYKKYKDKFMHFVHGNFVKRRGPLGYTLTLNEEDIILLTKICINKNQKLKLSVLFSEFERRGIYFDRDSKSKIIQLYEKLNLLEKKSDSGDAQYVRSIL